MTGRWLLMAAVLVAVVGGCRVPRPPDPRSATYYDGPTLPLAEVVDRINANNGRVETLWSSLEFDAILRDPQTGKETRLGGTGNLLYRAPDRFRLAGRKIEVGPLFDMGTDGQTFWLAVFPEQETLWYGQLANAGRACCEPIPVRPELVGQVLAVGTYSTEFMREPFPVMRFDHDRDAYAIVSHVRLPDRLAASREVYYDRQTLLPIDVRLFDENGRALLKARLGDHKPLGEGGPSVARAYDVFLTDSRSQIILRMGDARPSKGGVPGAASFERPSGRGLRQVELDANCTD